MASCCSCSCLATAAMATTSALNVGRASTRLVYSLSFVCCSLGANPRTLAFGQSLIVSKRKGTNPRERRSSAVMVVRAEGEEGVLKSRPAEGDDGALRSQQLAYEGPGRGGQWLSATTRHVRIYVGVADPVTKVLDQSQLDKLTLMLDPDNEFVWPDEQVQKVYEYFTELVDGYEGAPCTEYTLRLIGSDIEHYIRKLLLANEIKYNLEAGVLNFSMGLPRYDPSTLAGVEEEAG